MTVNALHNKYDLCNFRVFLTLLYIYIAATVTHNSSETWYKKLLDMIDLQQQQQIWMSEKKVKVFPEYIYYFITFIPTKMSVVVPHSYGFESYLRLDSFLWGNYLARLQIKGGSTQVPAWNNARKGAWGHPPPIKLVIVHITCNVLV
jgi:hypothetical protein